jgi:serine/threonine protein phosphatase PrpC
LVCRCLVLATDGLWDVVDEQTSIDVVEGVLAQNRAAARKLPGERLARAAAKALVQKALARNTHDNVTCLVALPDWEGLEEGRETESI